MAKTVLITGASSGFGKDAALFFKSKGWNVAASMRSPEKAEAWTVPAGLFASRLDVTDRASMQSAIDENRQQVWRDRRSGQQCRLRVDGAARRRIACRYSTRDRNEPDGRHRDDAARPALDASGRERCDHRSDAAERALSGIVNSCSRFINLKQRYV